MKKKTKIYKLTLTALLAAVICVLAPIAVPIPVSETPLSLGTFAIYLAGCLLGWKLGTMSVFIYILIGCAGVPVFAGWTAGIGRVVGPTGGYLLGYLAVAFISGWFAEHFEKKLVMYYVGLVLATTVCYCFGTIWMGVTLHLSPKAAIAAGVLPYLLLDAIKILAAGSLAYPLRKQLKQFLPEFLQQQVPASTKSEI